MARFRQPWHAFRWIALALYLAATLSAGFSHRAVAQAVDPLAEFVLPDGTRPVICSTPAGDTDSASPAKATGGLCEACRLTAVPGLPPVDGSGCAVERTLTHVVYLADAIATTRGSAPAAHRARGPPMGALIA